MKIYEVDGVSYICSDLQARGLDRAKDEKKRNEVIVRACQRLSEYSGEERQAHVVQGLQTTAEEAAPPDIDLLGKDDD